MFGYNKDNVHSKQRREIEIKRIIHNKKKQLNGWRSNEKAKIIQNRDKKDIVKNRIISL